MVGSSIAGSLYLRGVEAAIRDPRGTRAAGFHRDAGNPSGTQAAQLYLQRMLHRNPPARSSTTATHGILTTQVEGVTVGRHAWHTHLVMAYQESSYGAPRTERFCNRHQGQRQAANSKGGSDKGPPPACPVGEVPYANVTHLHG